MNTRKTGALAALLVGAVLMVSGADTVYAAESTYADASKPERAYWQVQIALLSQIGEGDIEGAITLLESGIGHLSGEDKSRLVNQYVEGVTVDGGGPLLSLAIQKATKVGAADRGLHLIWLLISYGADVNAATRDHRLSTRSAAWTPLHVAVGTLVKRPEGGWLPGYLASADGTADIVGLLIASGAQCDKVTRGIRAIDCLKTIRSAQYVTPLGLAIQLGNVRAVEAFIRNRSTGDTVVYAKPNSPGDSQTALQYVQMQTLTPAIRQIIEKLSPAAAAAAGVYGTFTRTGRIVFDSFSAPLARGDHEATHSQIAELVTPPLGVAPRPSVAERRGDASVYADMSGQYTEMSSWEHPAT